jgi:long-chain fatty acid transport protein
MFFLPTPIFVLIAACVLSLLTPVVSASSDPAFAGIAAKANDSMSANHNPAGLARISESEWTGRVIWFNSESTFDASGESLGGASTTEDSGDTVVPVVYYARPLTDRLGVGFSFQGVSFSEDYGNGPQRYLAEEYTLSSISFVPALGFKLNDKWFVGAGLSVNYSEFEIESAVFNGIGQPDGRFELEADDIDLGFTAGLVYELSPHTRFGVRYQSESNPELSGTPEYSKAINPPDKQEITIKNTFPQSVTVGVYHEFADRSWMTTDLSLIEFSEFGFSEFRIGDNSIEPREQNFDDTWAITAGYNHRLNSRWILKTGAIYVDQPVSDENRTSTWRLDSM